jgi:hypothetical protein
MQMNSTPQKETGRKEYRIPASLLGKGWLYAKTFKSARKRMGFPAW